MSDATTVDFDQLMLSLERIRKMRKNQDFRLTVRISNAGGLTAHQTVDAVGIYPGFDWENGQIVVETAQPLTRLTAEQVEDITKSVRAGGSWHAYEREKKLREKIKALEAEIASLRAAAAIGGGE